METIACPFCQFACKPTALLCPSCGLIFQRWMEAHPGQVIDGWTPPKGSLESPKPEPVAAEASAKPGSAVTATAPKPELDPKAKALIELYKTEAAMRTNKSDIDKAPGRSGLVIIALGIACVFFGLILATQRFKGDGLAFATSFYGAPLLIIAAIGAFYGHRRFVMGGIALGVVDFIVCASHWSMLGAALRNTMVFKFMLLGYLAKLAYDMR
jgi:hypothetical protein